MTDVEALYMWVGVLVGIVTLLGAFAGLTRWMVKHYLQELRPNGGGSLKDQVNRLDARMDKSDTLRKETYHKVEKLEKKIDDLYDKFIAYLSNKD